MCGCQDGLSSAIFERNFTVGFREPELADRGRIVNMKIESIIALLNYKL